MSPKRPQSEFVHISSVLNRVLNAGQITSGGDLNRILSLWDTTVGTIICANAQPAALKESLLLVHVASSTWMQQLIFNKQEILNKLNQALGEAIVTDISFRIGPLK